MNELVGLYFYGQRKEKTWVLGRVIGRLTETQFLVQFLYYQREKGDYDHGPGLLYNLEDMMEWVFYSELEEAREAYEKL
jgi:hypothetical protein